MSTEVAPWEPYSLSYVSSEEGGQTQHARLGVDMYTITAALLITAPHVIVN